MDTKKEVRNGTMRGNGKNGVKECEGKLSEVLLCRPGKEAFDRQTEEGVHLRVFTYRKNPGCI